MLIIDPSSLPGNVTVDDPGQATVTIMDDDCKYLVNNAVYIPLQMIYCNPSSTDITVQVTSSMLDQLLVSTVVF